MVGWIEYLGRLITFVIEKVTGKKIDISLDDRRRAARKFMSLYHAISDLEVLSKEVAVELRVMVQESNATVSRDWFRDISLAVDETSQRFLEATQGLRKVLEIFDPVLAATVSGLEADKFSFLLVAARGFEAVGDEKVSVELEYTRPSDQLSSLDWAKNYDWCAAHYPLDYSNSIEWPTGVALSFVDESEISNERLSLTDPGSMNRLADFLDLHLQALVTARATLGNFLRERFTIDDLLAVQQPSSELDRIHAMYRMSDAVGIPYVRWFAGKAPRKFQTRDRKE